MAQQLRCLLCFQAFQPKFNSPALIQSHSYSSPSVCDPDGRQQWEGKPEESWSLQAPRGPSKKRWRRECKSKGRGGVLTTLSSRPRVALIFMTSQWLMTCFIGRGNDDIRLEESLVGQKKEFSGRSSGVVGGDYDPGILYY